MYNMDTNLYELANDEYECDEVNSVTVEVDVLNDISFQWGSTLIRKDIIDWSRLQYNKLYKTFDYFDSRFSGDYSHIPGFELIIEKIAENVLTPLEEMEQRKYDDLLYNNE